MMVTVKPKMTAEEKAEEKKYDALMAHAETQHKTILKKIHEMMSSYKLRRVESDVEVITAWVGGQTRVNRGIITTLEYTDDPKAKKGCWYSNEYKINLTIRIGKSWIAAKKKHVYQYTISARVGDYAASRQKPFEGSPFKINELVTDIRNRIELNVARKVKQKEIQKKESDLKNRIGKVGKKHGVVKNYWTRPYSCGKIDLEFSVENLVQLEAIVAAAKKTGVKDLFEKNKDC